MNEKQIKIALVAGFAIVAIAVIIFLPKILPPKEPPKVTYNGFEFQKIEGMWYTQWQHQGRVYNLPLRYNPYDVEDVIVSGVLNDSFNDNEEVYITFDSVQNKRNYTALAVTELSLSFIKGPFQKKIVIACTENITVACETRPTVSCQNPGLSVIQIIDWPKPVIIANQTCVILLGRETDLMKAVDRFLYEAYGIIKQENATALLQPNPANTVQAVADSSSS